MAILEREFYRSFRGPRIGDEDQWHLVFDPPRLQVRHSWQSVGHNGLDEFNLDEFLSQPSEARDALITLLFELETADT